MKITIVGAGNVGATTAQILAEKEVGNNIVLIDVKKGLAEGKALDIWQSSPIGLYDTRVKGVTENLQETADPDVVVITSGLPRKPGMSREDLISNNALIVKHVTENMMRYSPNAIFIVVSNPLDVMSYTAYITSGLEPHRVIGMAGILDSARYRSFIADELDCSPKDIQAVILGGHGDTMVPLPRYTSVAGVPVTQLIDKERLDTLIQRTIKGGGELVKLMGTSAWTAPGYATARMVEAVVYNQKRYFPISSYLTGQYGIDGIFFGVPAKLGKNGIEEILEIELNDEEKQLLRKSEKAVHENTKTLKRILKEI